MITVQVESDAQAVRFIGKLLAPAAIKAVARTIETLSIDLAAHIKTTTYPGSGLHVRTGALRRSIVPLTVEQKPGLVRGGVIAGQRLAYARIQEFGGTIVPKRASWLTIPLDAAKTPAGVPRFTAPEAAQAGYKTFVRNHIIFGQKPGSAVEALFVLKKSVTIPARPYMRPALQDFKSRIIRDIAAAVGAEVRKMPQS